MTSAQFKAAQKKLGWTNRVAAAKLYKCEQSISNYRSDRQAIPKHVEALLNEAVARL